LTSKCTAIAFLHGNSYSIQLLNKTIKFKNFLAMTKFISTLLTGVLGGMIVLGAAKWFEKPQDSLPSTPSAAVRQVNYGASPAPVDFTRAADRSMSAVVHIKATESRRAASARQRELRTRDPFSFFFGEYEPQQRSGTGSGVIYSNDGYILTNNHVVEFADEFTVTLHDNREFKARMVGRDPNTDMAVIKIDQQGLPSIELGNSDEVRVGEWVLAVGNPFDLTSTVTAGIVSAKGRNINIIRSNAPIESFIQTDAAVNPGNSGGALVDVNGRLIGINSAIATPTGVFAGYSFAIPVNLAKRIADDLIKYGEYRRPYLGINIAEMTTENAAALNIPYTQGVIVSDLDANGSAANSGLEQYDVITKINGKSVTNGGELLEMIGRSKVGDNVTLTLNRNGREKQIDVKLQPRRPGN
jgi:serine protease Do